MSAAAAAGIPTTLTFASDNALYDSGLTPFTDAGRHAYADYIVATLQKYGGEVKEIEIWNEFNTDNFTGPASDDRDASYVALLKTVYQTVKPLFPDVQILGGSSNVVATGAIEAILKLGAGAYMDGVAIHPYRGTPEHVDDELLHLQAVMAEYGAVKPIYATEFGKWFSDPTEAPDFMLKMTTLMSSVHVAQADWYALLDDSDNTNMGLFDRSGNAKPAAAAFSFIAHTLIPLGDAVKIDTGDDRTMIYKFGADTYVMWGDTRTMSFATGSSFYNAKGEAITAPTGLAYAPFVVKTSGYVMGETHVVADSLLEYGDSNVWQYYAKDVTSGQLTSLSTVDWDWTSYLGSKYTKPLRINADSIAPAGDTSHPIQALERYTSDKIQTLQLTGHWDVGTDGDGIDLHILVNGREVFSKIFNGAYDLSGLSITLQKGDTLDFAIGPHQNVTGDSASYRIQLISTTAPATIPNPTPVPGAPLTLSGTGGNDVLVGDTGNDLFYGSGGKDSYDGRGGTDTVSFEKVGLSVSVDLSKSGYQTLAHNLSDQFVAIENLVGSRFGDTLTGNAGANRLDGGDGKDTLIGGGGQDVLIGGSGGDMFAFKAVADSTVLSPDRILDFSHAQGDIINLAGIDAKSATMANDVFRLVTAFTHHAGEVVGSAHDGGVLVRGDVDGDGVADFSIQVYGATSLTSSDFIL